MLLSEHKSQFGMGKQGRIQDFLKRGLTPPGGFGGMSRGHAFWGQFNNKISGPEQ